MTHKRHKDRWTTCLVFVSCFTLPVNSWIKLHKTLPDWSHFHIIALSACEWRKLQLHVRGCYSNDYQSLKQFDATWNCSLPSCLLCTCTAKRCQHHEILHQLKRYSMLKTCTLVLARHQWKVASWNIPQSYFQPINSLIIVLANIKLFLLYEHRNTS